MKQAVVEKERGKEPPKFAFVDNGEEIERAQPMQRNRIAQRSSMELDIKCADVEQNNGEYGSGRRTTPSTSSQ